MDQKLKLTRTEQNILKEMTSAKNRDGFYQIILEQYNIRRNFSILKLVDEFDNAYFAELIKKLYDEEKNHCNFIKKIHFLVQLSIQKKILSGKATEQFIKNIAYITDLSWLKKETFQENSSKKIKLTYFFKRFEEIFIFSNSIHTKKEKSQLLYEYVNYSQKVSRYIIDLFLDNSYTSFDDSDTQRYLLFNSLKNSF